MKLNNEQYEALYEEIIALNEDNLDGKFFVNTINELKEQAVKYLKDEYFDEETLNIFQEEETDISSLLNILWNDKGLYVFVGLHWETGYNLYHINDVFELETEVDPLIFLGDSETIEKEIKQWYESVNYIYAVWDYNSKLIYCYRDDKLRDEYDILKLAIRSHRRYCYDNDFDYIIDNKYKRFRGSYFVSELRQLGNYEFYDFLRQYAEQDDLL